MHLGGFWVKLCLKSEVEKPPLAAHCCFKCSVPYSIIISVRVSKQGVNTYHESKTIGQKKDGVGGDVRALQ